MKNSNRGVSIMEGMIAAVVLAVAVVIAVVVIGSQQKNLSREEMVSTQAREMNQLSRSVLDYAVKNPAYFTTGKHTLTVAELHAAGVLPADFGQRAYTGKTGAVSPLGQTYVIKAVSVAATPPQVQVVISVTGAPVASIVEQAKIGKGAKALAAYDGEVTQELRTRLRVQSGFVPANTNTLDAALSGYAIDLGNHLDTDRTYSTPVAVSGFSMVIPLTGQVVARQENNSNDCTIASSGTCPTGTTSGGTVDPCGAFKQAFTQYIDPRDGQTKSLSGSYNATTWSGVKMHAVFPDKVTTSVAGSVVMSAGQPISQDGRLRCGSHITLVGASSGSGVQEGCGIYQKTVERIDSEGMPYTLVQAGYKCYNGIEYTQTQYNSLTASFKAQQTTNVINANMQMVYDYPLAGADEVIVQRARWITNAPPATPPWNENDPQACGANITAKNDGSGVDGFYRLPPFNTSGLPLEYSRKGSASVNGLVVATQTCLTEARTVNVESSNNNTWTSTLQPATQPALCCGTAGNPVVSVNIPPDETDSDFWMNERCSRPQIRCKGDGLDGRTGLTRSSQDCLIIKVC